MTEQSAIGTPHPYPDTADPPDTFTGTDPKADEGEPGDLGAAIGVPSSGQEIGEPFQAGDPS